MSGGYYPYPTRRNHNIAFNRLHGHVATNVRTGGVMATHMNRGSGLPGHFGRTTRSGSYVTHGNIHGSFHPLGPNSHSGMIHCKNSHGGIVRCVPRPNGSFNLSQVGKMPGPGLYGFAGHFANAVGHATGSHPGPAFALPVGGSAPPFGGAGAGGYGFGGYPPPSSGTRGRGRGKRHARTTRRLRRK